MRSKRVNQTRSSTRYSTDPPSSVPLTFTISNEVTPSNVIWARSRASDIASWMEAPVPTSSTAFCTVTRSSWTRVGGGRVRSRSLEEPVQVDQRRHEQDRPDDQ